MKTEKSDWIRVDWLGPNLNDFDRVIVCDLAMNTGIRKYWAYILNPALTHELDLCKEYLYRSRDLTDKVPIGFSRLFGTSPRKSREYDETFGPRLAETRDCLETYKSHRSEKKY
jgi:hypothetical protein